MAKIDNSDFQAGDLLAFSGSDWLSRLIKACTCSPRYWFRAHWRCTNHIGICCDFRGKQVLIESTTQCDAPSLFPSPRSAAGGVQAHWPEQRVAEFPGPVFRARLVPHWRLDQIESQRLTEFLLDFRGAAYDFVGALRAGIGTARAADLHRLFCSEIVAAALCRVFRLRDSNPSDWTPVAILEELVQTGKVTIERIK